MLKENFMAIYGIGYMWDKEEKLTDFLTNEYVQIGHELIDAQDAYNLLQNIKVGDIVYLKSFSHKVPGKIYVQGIGIVYEDIMRNSFFTGNNIQNCINSIGNIKVKWISKKLLQIKYPYECGKLTNFRSATIYEELLFSVQTEIINEITKSLLI